MAKIKDVEKVKAISTVDNNHNQISREIFQFSVNNISQVDI